MVSSSKTTKRPGGSAASSMTLIPGDGKYGVKNIDDLKPVSDIWMIEKN